MAEDFKAEGPDWQKRHLEAYLDTDGAIGHFIDFTPLGGPAHTPCLVLETIGRKSGKPQRLPLIYGEEGDGFVIIASKGGAPEHPAWYLNLLAKPDVKVQVAGTKYRCLARTVESPDRERLYAMMAKIYPPYIAYQEATDREIPVVLLEATAEIDRL
jgi:deazaflavin-dependent oxidoreductase (nitroreductase family)